MWKYAAAGLAAVAAGCLVRSSYERKHFVTDIYDLKSEKISRDWTFVFLSDLHNNCFGQGQEQLLEAIAAQKPDGVLIGGDMMVVKKGAELDTALFLVRKLAEKYPVFYGNGNHESRMDRKREIYGSQYDVFVSELKKAGVCHLSDKCADISPEIRICGFDLERRFYEKFSPEVMSVSDIEKKIGKAEPEKYQILLAHSPSYRQIYAEWGADLTLSGHFHGGTIIVPGLGGLMTPQFDFFHDCCYGKSETNGKIMIVSRGLGTHSINIRLNNKPELVVIRLHPGR